VVYNASKAYVMQLRSGDDYPKLCDVMGVTICDFKLWPKKIKDQGYKVPMLSRWHMQEQQSGHKGLRQIQYVFLELPKYNASNEPTTLIEKWAYFFREAKNLEVVPAALSKGPFREALEIARRSTFTTAEWETYEHAKMAEQDERGAISLARKEGVVEGRKEGVVEGRKEGVVEGRKEGLVDARASAVVTVLQVRGIVVSETERDRIMAEKDLTRLENWLKRAATAASIAEVIDEQSESDRQDR
jgi:predicted transposase/invertase (TIGR01784 family)